MGKKKVLKIKKNLPLRFYVDFGARDKEYCNLEM